jgi:hypothetical protein
VHTGFCWLLLTVAALAPVTGAGQAARAELPPPPCGLPPDDGSTDKACKHAPGDKRASWRLIAVSPSVRVFANPGTLRGDRSLRSAWLLWSHDQQQKLPGGASYHAFKELAVFDCKARAHASRQQIYYADGGAAGDVVHRTEVAGAELEYLEYAPGSLGEAVIQAACTLQRK